MAAISVLFIGVPRLTWEIVAPTLAAEADIKLLGHVDSVQDIATAVDVAIVSDLGADSGALAASLGKRVDVIGISVEGRDGFLHVPLDELTAARVRDLILQTARPPFREQSA